MVKSKKRKKKQGGKKGIIKHIQIQWAKKKKCMTFTLAISFFLGYGEDNVTYNN